MAESRCLYRWVQVEGDTWIEWVADLAIDGDVWMVFWCVGEDGVRLEKTPRVERHVGEMIPACVGDDGRMVEG